MSHGLHRHIAACALLVSLTACGVPTVVVQERPHTRPPIESTALTGEDFCVDIEPTTDDAAARQRLTEALAAALSRVGIEAGAPGEGACPLVIEADARVVYEIPAAGTDPPAWHLHLALTVVDRDEGHRRAVDDRMLHVVERGPTATDALVSASGRLAEYALLPLSTTLLSQPRLYTLVTRGLVPLSGMVRKVDDLRAAQARRATEAVSIERAEDEAEHARLPMTRITPVLAERYYLGDSPDGGMLLLTEPHYLHMSYGGNQHLMRAESEQIIEIGPDGRSALRFEHTEIDAFPVVGDGGRLMVLGTRDPDGTGQLVALDLSGDGHRVLRTLGPGERVAPQVHESDGAVFYRFMDDSGSSLRVVGADGAGDRELMASVAAMGSPEPAADGSRVWVPWGLEGVDTISEIDVATGSRQVVLGRARTDLPAGDPRAASRFTYAAPLPGADALVVVERHDVDGAFVGRFELSTERYERLAALAVDRRVELSPDGRWLAIDVAAGTPPDDPAPTDVELALVDTTTGRVHWVTSNALDDRLGLFSADGRSLYIRHATREPAHRFMTSRVYRVDVSGL